MTEHTCGLCGHEMDFNRCGLASVGETYLCHSEDHDCYRQYTYSRTLDMLETLFPMKFVGGPT